MEPRKGSLATMRLNAKKSSFRQKLVKSFDHAGAGSPASSSRSTPKRRTSSNPVSPRLVSQYFGTPEFAPSRQFRRVDAEVETPDGVAFRAAGRNRPTRATNSPYRKASESALFSYYANPYGRFSHHPQKNELAPAGASASNRERTPSTASLSACTRYRRKEAVSAKNPFANVSSEFMKLPSFPQKKYSRLLSNKPLSATNSLSAKSREGNFSKSTLIGVLTEDDETDDAEAMSPRNGKISLTSSDETRGSLLDSKQSVPFFIGSDHHGSISTLNSNRRQKISIVSLGKTMIPRILKDSHKNNNDRAGYRLGVRERIFLRRTLICDMCLIMAIIGIALMMIDSELSILVEARKKSIASIVIRGIIVVTTVALLVFLCMYHACEIELVMVDGGTDDWRVAITGDRVAHLLVELSLCAICPFPGSGYIDWPYTYKPSENDAYYSVTYVSVPTDVILSVPMFMRFYLFGRVMVVHSRLFQDAATRSIAALNQISVNFNFVLKTLMQETPTTVLVTFTVCFWIVMSWLYTQCERYSPFKPANATVLPQDSVFGYFNSLWLVIITFMSIGYGDIVPHTYCGRSVSITTGIMGIAVASALVAVISRKLELSLAERHVNSFLGDTKLAKQRKHTAALILQHMWFIYKYRYLKLGRNENKVRAHQRKLLKAINDFRQVKWEQRRHAEQSSNLTDIAKVQSDIQESVYEMNQNQRALIAEVSEMGSRISDLCHITGLSPRKFSRLSPAEVIPEADIDEDDSSDTEDR